jgi:hypothetical protein
MIFRFNFGFRIDPSFTQCSFENSQTALFMSPCLKNG